MISPHEEDDFEKYLKKRPNELIGEKEIDRDYKELEKNLNKLKDKGVIINEKDANQDMHRLHDRG